MTGTHDSQPEPAPERELFIDFVNAFRRWDGEADRDADPQALGAWLREQELLPGRIGAERLERDSAAFRQLRDLVRDLVTRLADGRPLSARQLTALNRVLRDGLHYHQVVPDPSGSRFTVSQVGDDLAQARAAIAGSLAHYLAEHDRDRLRVCADDTCRWLFVDRSPAGRRRWCDMRTCGNRAKVARHRARARRGQAAARRPD